MLIRVPAVAVLYITNTRYGTNVENDSEKVSKQAAQKPQMSQKDRATPHNSQNLPNTDPNFFARFQLLLRLILGKFSQICGVATHELFVLTPFCCRSLLFAF